MKIDSQQNTENEDWLRFDSDVENFELGLMQEFLDRVLEDGSSTDSSSFSSAATSRDTEHSAPSSFQDGVQLYEEVVTTSSSSLSASIEDVDPQDADHQQDGVGEDQL